MKPYRILLNSALYQEYLNGNEIECTPDLLPSEDIKFGDHVLVFKKTIASTMDLPTPTREEQSALIGIEGTITQVTVLSLVGGGEQFLQSVFIRKL